MQLAKDLQSIPQILVVEDDENDMELMRLTLTGIGCEVYPAKSVDEAYRVIDARIVSDPEWPFDVVFLDLKLIGGQDGTEVLRRMSVKAPSVPVVIVTGYPESRALEEAFRISYFGMVQKPLEKEAVRQIFKKHRIPHEEPKKPGATA
jgi:two-component system response regulator PilR (NtrC family)